MLEALLVHMYSCVMRTHNKLKLDDLAIRPKQEENIQSVW